MDLKRGQFATVGQSIGVVVLIEGDQDVPEDHIAIWYGETNLSGSPKIRTVPAEYVIPLICPPEIYH